MSNLKISEMTEATSLGDSDLLTIVQSGINKKITKQNAIGDIITALNNPTYTTGTGTALTLNNTRVGRIKSTLYGNTEQDTYNGENLFDKDNPNILNNCVTGSSLTLENAEGCKTLYIPCKPNLTYTITKVASTRFIVVTTTNTPAIGVATSTRTIDLTGTSITITTGATANYLCVFYYYSLQDTLTEQEILNSIYIKIDTPIPNPNYPIDVQTVTGENTINIVGRNICPDTFSKYNVFSPYTQYNLPIPSGTECIMSFTDNDTSIDISGCYIGFKDSGTGAPTSIRWCISNGSVLSDTTNIPSTGTDWCGTICIYPNTEETFNKLFGRYKIQVEIGNTISNYIQYKEGQSYKINLGANLFDSKNVSKINANFNASSVTTLTGNSNVTTIYIPCLPYVTYTLSKSKGARFYVGYTKTTPATGVTVYERKGADNSTEWTLTTGADAKYLVAYVYASSVDTSYTEQDILNTIQICYGSHPEIPIELCKIGDYQDYIYKSGGNWYKHKEIEKKIFVGTETIIANQITGTSYYRMTYTLNTAKNSADLGNTKTTFSPYFRSGTFNERNTDYKNTIFQVSNGLTTGLGLVFNTNVATTATDFQTWLTTHNTDFYYLLKDPEEVLITNQYLINQLNALYEAESYYDTTNVLTEGQDLTPIVTIEALEKIV